MHLFTLFTFFLFSLYGSKCFLCELAISPNELVMKALEKIYHVECFKCDECGDKLEKGDEFILKDDKLYCSADFNVAEQRSDSKYHRQVFIPLIIFSECIFSDIIFADNFRRIIIFDFNATEHRSDSMYHKVIVHLIIFSDTIFSDNFRQILIFDFNFGWTDWTILKYHEAIVYLIMYSDIAFSWIDRSMRICYAFWKIITEDFILSVLKKCITQILPVENPRRCISPVTDRNFEYQGFLKTYI